MEAHCSQGPVFNKDVTYLGTIKQSIKPHMFHVHEEGRSFAGVAMYIIRRPSVFLLGGCLLYRHGQLSRIFAGGGPSHISRS